MTKEQRKKNLLCKLCTKIKDCKMQLPYRNDCNNFVVTNSVKGDRAKLMLANVFGETPYHKLMLAIIVRAIEDYCDNILKLESENARKYLFSGYFPEAEICGIESAYITKVLKTCMITNDMHNGD